MTVWTLNLPLSSEEEHTLTQRSHLPLPYDNLPDLTHVTSQAEATQLLRALFPGEPPESLATRREKFWNVHAGMQKEDLIAVPLLHSRHIAIAQISGAYEYRVGERGIDIHLIPVSWPCTPVPMYKFRKVLEILQRPGIREVKDRDAKNAIRGKLPHSYNRFDKWKWLLIVFMGMGLLRIVMGLAESAKL